MTNIQHTNFLRGKTKLVPARQSSDITEIENSSKNYKCLPTLTNKFNLFKSSLLKVSKFQHKDQMKNITTQIQVPLHMKQNHIQ